MLTNSLNLHGSTSLVFSKVDLRHWKLIAKKTMYMIDSLF